MTYPTLSVQVAFGDDPLDTTPTWTDITDYVEQIRTNVGRSTELDEFPGGTAELVLDNSDRRFDPLHASGPYYGDLKSGVRVRIRATHSATTYTLFVGWVNGWPQDYSDDATSLTVLCSDAFAQLQGITLPESVFEHTVRGDAPWAWWRLRDPAGAEVQDSSGNGHTADLLNLDWSEVERIPLPVPGSTSKLAVQNHNAGAVWQVASRRAPAPGAGDELTWEAWVRITPVTGWTYYVTGLLRDWYGGKWDIQAGQPDAAYDRRLVVSGGVGNYKRTTTDVINDGSLHLYTVTADGTTIKFYVDGQEQLQTTVSGGPGVTPDVWLWRFPSVSTVGTTSSDAADVVVSIGEVQLYDRVLSSLEVLDHYNAATKAWSGDTTGERIDRVLGLVGWPAGLTDTDTGRTALGPARLDGRTALDYLRATAAAEQGHLVADPANDGRVTFRDRHHRLSATRSTAVQHVFTDEAGAGHHYEAVDLTYDDADIVNAAEVEWAGGTVTVEDDASITAYGRRSYRLATELATPTEARALGQWVIGRYRNPTVRCRAIELNPAAAQSIFPAALGTRIHDRVTVRKHPQQVGDPIEVDLIVEGVEHVIDQGVDVWTTTVRTSQADAGPWFLPDVATPGVSTLPAW